MKFLNSYLFIIILLFFTSCIVHKDLLILQGDVQNNQITTEQRPQGYLIQPGDILDIKVASMDPQSVAIFNKTVGESSTSPINEVGIFINGYIVSDSGYIEMPVVGRTLVRGKSVKEIEHIIEEKMDPFYKYFSVDIKLVSYRITIMGEVNRQGTYNIYNEHVNVLQVIAAAGGLTDVANIRKVRIVRKNENKSEVDYIDLSKADLVNSNYYYLQPNDVIYVQPLKIKAIKVNSTTAQLTLGVLTFIIVLLNFAKV